MDDRFRIMVVLAREGRARGQPRLEAAKALCSTGILIYKLLYNTDYSKSSPHQTSNQEKDDRTDLIPCLCT
jgi:hypothetical protein